MCGVWIPFEDISSDSGPLIYYAGSHGFPYLSAESLRFTPLDLDGKAHPQNLFQHEWERLLSASNLERTAFLPQRSEALIWQANLLHGGDIVKSKHNSRWSQVTHYFFTQCIYTTPMFGYSCQHGGATLRNPFDIISGSRAVRGSDWKYIHALRLLSFHDRLVCQSRRYRLYSSS